MQKSNGSRYFYLFFLINSKIEKIILILLIPQQTIKNTYAKLLFFKGNFKVFLIFYFLFSIFTFDLSKSETNDVTNSKNNQIDIEYLESRNELEDYIIGTGDIISLDFFLQFNLVEYFQ